MVANFVLVHINVAAPYGALFIFLQSEMCKSLEAVACTQTSGFVGSGCPELLLNALRARHDATGFPTKLKLIIAATAGDKKGCGTDQLAKPGLLTDIIYGWMGTAPGLMSMVEKQQLLAWNIPLGVGEVVF